MSREKIHIHNHYRKQPINKGKLAIIVLIILIITTIITIFFIKNSKNPAKNFKIGNNTTSQEIVNNILNISSYETKVEVEIKSNKNENRYIIKQTYNGEEESTQEVLEPSNIAGVKIIKNGKNLKLENTQLNLSTMFENYEYLSGNDLDLSSFIQDYKNNNKQEIKEKNNEIILKVNNQNRTRILYISKETGMPTKMEIQHNNKNLAIYILYNEVNVNS